MKRVDHLIGATVYKIEVSRNGRLRLYFSMASASAYCTDFNPLTVEIPKEPKKRKERARG